MKVSEIQYEQVRDFLLERVEPHPISKCKHYRCSCVELFIQWRHEVLTKLGDITVRVEKPGKLSSFKIAIK